MNVCIYMCIWVWFAYAFTCGGMCVTCTCSLGVLRTCVYQPMSLFKLHLSVYSCVYTRLHVFGLGMCACVLHGYSQYVYGICVLECRLVPVYVWMWFGSTHTYKSMYTHEFLLMCPSGTGDHLMSEATGCGCARRELSTNRAFYSQKSSTPTRSPGHGDHCASFGMIWLQEEGIASLG